MNDELLYQIAFSMLKGLRGNTALELLRRVGSAENFFKMRREELVITTGADSDLFSNAYRASLIEKAKNERIFVENNNVSVHFIGNQNYPKRLDRCEDAPTILYNLGKYEFNHKYSVGIVGTRHMTSYGMDFTNNLVAELAEMIPGITIISGLAYGVDVTAHKAALNANTPTVAVMAHGLKTIYPSEHRSIAKRIIDAGGALATEYSSDSQIFRGNFLQRNRIIAGLSDAVVVIESDMRGGSMSTARIAALYNRDVFAMPGRTTDQYSRGTNHLISNNIACLITSAEDIIKQMGWQARPLKEAPTLFSTLTEEQKQLLDFISSHPNATANEMCVQLGMSYASLSDRLFKLEMEDIIVSLPGGRYSISSKLKI